MKGSYSRLSKDPIQIRLRTLLSDSGAQAIEGTLEVVSLDDEEEYETLLYVWGKPEDPGAITLGRN